MNTIPGVTFPVCKHSMAVGEVWAGMSKTTLTCSLCEREALIARVAEAPPATLPENPASDNQAPVGASLGHTPEWVDGPLPEDDAIDAAFPTRSGRHDLYGEAMRLVGAKQTKGALVALVNWLLVEREDARLKYFLATGLHGPWAAAPQRNR